MGRVGEIIEGLFTNINEMPTIGSRLSNGKKIVILGNEGIGYPHFHVLKNNQHVGDACLCIKEAKYFSHGTHWGRLSKNELEEVVSILKSTQTKTPKPMSMWEYLIMMWNIENDDNIPLTQDMPNYLEMKDSDVIKS